MWREAIKIKRQIREEGAKIAAKAHQMSEVSRARLSMKSFRIKKLSQKNKVRSEKLADQMGRNIQSAYERARPEFK